MKNLKATEKALIEKFRPKLNRVKCQQGETVLIAAHYPPEVRRVLHLIQAETGMTVKQMLGHAINDLCAKYGYVMPYEGKAA